jgi:hypothetical protein
MSQEIEISTASDFQTLLKQADVLSQAVSVPSAYRRKPADIVACAMAGEAFGWNPMTSMRNFHIIEGTASMRPEAMLGLVRRAGHSVTCEIKHDEQGVRCAVVRGKRSDSGDEHQVIFSEHDAKQAGLTGKKNWSQYLDRMLEWRAVSAMCRFLFPDVVLGAGYVPEELGAEVTAIGDPIESDPFADESLSIAEAKRRVLAVFDDDREIAKEWWDRCIDPDIESIKESQLEALFRRYEDESDIQEADIVEEITVSLFEEE